MADVFPSQMNTMKLEEDGKLFFSQLQGYPGTELNINSQNVGSQFYARLHS